MSFLIGSFSPLQKVFTSQEMFTLLRIASGQESLEDHAGIYTRLYTYYMAEMPYGTAKCRDGDPYQWIQERLENELLD